MAVARRLGCHRLDASGLEHSPVLGPSRSQCTLAMPPALLQGRADLRPSRSDSPNWLKYKLISKIASRSRRATERVPQRSGETRQRTTCCVRRTPKRQHLPESLVRPPVDSNKPRNNWRELLRL